MSFLLGSPVGLCIEKMSSFSTRSSVVLPALSNPRNSNFPDFLYNPRTN